MALWRAHLHNCTSSAANAPNLPHAMADQLHQTETTLAVELLLPMKS